MANSEDPDQEQSDLGLHCLSRPVCQRISEHYGTNDSNISKRVKNRRNVQELTKLEPKSCSQNQNGNIGSCTNRHNTVSLSNREKSSNYHGIIYRTIHQNKKEVINVSVTYSLQGPGAFISKGMKEIVEVFSL